MNQYIITEEKLAEIESTPNEDTKDWLQTFYGLCDGVRSHLYQSERDKMLTTFVERIKERRYKSTHGQPPYNYVYVSDIESELELFMEELRQKAGEP